MRQKKQHDRRYGSQRGKTLLAERIKAREEREARAASYRQALEGELVGIGGNPALPSMQALLDSATSAHLEISRTTKRFVHGAASAKAMHRLGLARSELRRALRALGLIADSGEAAPVPAGPSLEELKRPYEVST
jgi:hypothetical protein